MKYGKEFQQILNDPSLPPEWRSSAIEYGRLKKLIKDVVAELSGMGLSPDVLHKLLSAEQLKQAQQAGNTGTGSATIEDESSGTEKETPTEEDDILEFEFESPEHSPPSFTRRSSSPAPQEVVIAPVTDETDEEESQVRGHGHHRTFRLRLLSETQAEKPESKQLKPMGVMDMIRSRTEPKRRASMPVRAKQSPEKKKRVVRRAVADGHGGVKAEYVLVGDSDHPTPQLRLHLSATSTPDRRPGSSASSYSPSESQATTDSETDPITSESEDEPEFEPKASTTRPSLHISPQHTPRAFVVRSPPAVPDIDVIPPSPTLQKLRQAVSPIWALASGASISDGLRDLTLDDDEEATTPTQTSHPLAALNIISDPPDGHSASSSSVNPSTDSTHLGTSPPADERDFIIPLASDVAFFNLLTAALTSLSAFHAAQQEQFRQSVGTLCGMIRQSIQPGEKPEVLATPLTPTPQLPAPSTSQAIVRQPNQAASKKDLYAWREIFTLWIEHEIFESNAERTRGERTVEQAQERLQKFANEVVKRGLGDRRTIRGKKARGAWEEFLRLNVLLLDLKKFQLANINAARKILKKHDKRTALTASAGFPSFVRSSLVNSIDSAGNISTWSFYNTSLPHVLLASLTDTLLPILPSLDDYACLICTSIAFKPIRLGCGHLFCVRCLVKMQRAGKGECPLCRSKVVLLADKNSLDTTLMRFMKDWFPKEVKEKQKENDRELAFERAGTAEADRCIIM